MEALLEREGQVENWNDQRLDEMSQTMKEGFAKSDREMKEGFVRVDRQFEKADREANRQFDEMRQRFNGSDARSERFESKVGTEFHRFTDRLDKLFYLQIAFMTSLALGLLTDAI